MKLSTPRAGSLVTSAVLLPLAVLCTSCQGEPQTSNTKTVESEKQDTTSSSASPGTTTERNASSSGVFADPSTTNADEAPSKDGGASNENPSVNPAGNGQADSAVAITGHTQVGSRCERATRIGGLGVNLGEDRTIVSGSVSDDVLPSSVPRVHTESGTCQLLVPRDLFCQGCSPDETCAGNDECVPKPAKVSAGLLEVDGLFDSVQVSPNGITKDYSKTLLDPFPAYEVGAPIEVFAQGDLVPGFRARLFGVPKLESAQEAISVTRGESATIEWDTEGVDPNQSAVFVTFSVNVHGAVTGWVECVSPDTGNFKVPEELVTRLIDLGLSGFPRAELERRSSATVELPRGCVDVVVASKVTLDIEVDGLKSCNDDSECDEGQTCNEELACE